MYVHHSARDARSIVICAWTTAIYLEIKKSEQGTKIISIEGVKEKKKEKGSKKTREGNAITRPATGSDMQLEYLCCISGSLYYYYSQPVPRFHFTRPWYNKRTTY